MHLSRRAIVVATIVAALVVFCEVQDRVTVAGARRYASAQRDALAGRGPAVTIDEIMAPVIRGSVRQALFWSGLVFVSGSLLAAASSRGTPHR